MAQYKVVVGPLGTDPGCISLSNLIGASSGAQAAAPVENLIQKMASEGWQFHSVTEHISIGACCCIFPKNKILKLYVFQKG